MDKVIVENSVEVSARDPWYSAAVAAVVIAGVFSLIVIVLLSVNHYHFKITHENRALKLEEMKLELAKTEYKEQFLADIRQFDLEIREEKLSRVKFSRTGGYLLVVALAIFFGCLKFIQNCNKKLPSPQHQSEAGPRQLLQTRQANIAVTVTVVIFVGIGLLLMVRPAIDLGSGEAVAAYPLAEQIAANWPTFRGPAGSGISTYTNIPTEWDGASGKGIVWKSEIPIGGNNSPIVWDDRVFISGGHEEKREVYCYDADSGALLWIGDVTAPAMPGADEFEEPMEDTGFAAPTMATDGKRVFAIFANGDIGAFDFNGKNLWSKNLGTPDNMYGYASSLTMYQNMVIVQYDQGMGDDGKSRLIALDGFSGRAVWEVKRMVPNSWTSPVVANIDGRDVIVTCGDPWVIAYDAATAAELWRVDCIGGDLAPSPIYAGNFVLAAEPDSRLIAIRTDGTGDVTETHIVWKTRDGIGDITSPVSDGELIFLTAGGRVTCLQLSDAVEVWEEDTDGYFMASPSLAGGRLYVLSDDGAMYILKAGREFEQLGLCELGEDCFATPAFADGRIYIRGVLNLYCIGSTE